MAGRNSWEGFDAFMGFVDANGATLAETGLAEIGILFAREDTRIVHPSGERLLAAGGTYAVLRFRDDGDVRERGNPFVDAFATGGPHWSVQPTAAGDKRFDIELLRDGLQPCHRDAFRELERRIHVPVVLAASWIRLPAGDGPKFRYVRLRDLRSAARPSGSIMDRLRRVLSR